MVQPLITRNIPADFLTVNHYVFGQALVSNTGMLGLLCDATTSFVEMNDASVARIVKPDKIINYASSMWLVKTRVVCVGLGKPDYVGSATLARSGYTRVYQYPVQIITPVYEIQGTLEWAGRFDFSIVMSESSHPFLTLYDTKITASLFPAFSMEMPVMLFNRLFLDTLVHVRRTGGIGPAS
jgi:hypothetical protein